MAAHPAKAGDGRKGPLGRWLALAALLLAFILVPYALGGVRLEAWVASLVRAGSGRAPWVGLGLASLLAADVVLPVPSSLASTGCGLALGWFWGTVASFAGLMAGSVGGYALGRWGGRRAVRRLLEEADYERLARWQRRFGAWAIALTRPVPVLAEAATLTAGLGAMPLGRYLVVSALANLGVSAVYAAAGAWAVRGGAWLLAFAFSLGLPALLMACTRGRGSGGPQEVRVRGLACRSQGDHDTTRPTDGDAEG